MCINVCSSGQIGTIEVRMCHYPVITLQKSFRFDTFPLRSIESKYERLAAQHWDVGLTRFFFRLLSKIRSGKCQG